MQEHREAGHYSLPCLLYGMLLLGCVLGGCGPSVRTGRLDMGTSVSMVRENIVSSGKLSMETAQILRMAGKTLGEGIAEADTVVDLPEITSYTDELRQRYATSELMLARAAVKKDSPETADYYIEAAHEAFEGIQSQECQTAVNFLCDNFKVFYVRAIYGLLQALQKNDWNPDRLPLTEYALTVKPQTPYEDLALYDSVDPSGTVSVSGLANRHSRFGVGIPLVACRQKDPQDPHDFYLPTVGTCLPISAVLNFPEKRETGRFPVTLELYNAFSTETVELRGQRFPLAANFSTPFASMLERTGLTDFSGMFSAFSGNDTLLKMTGFYTAEPYDSGKIPLVTVHGLFSSPITWVSLQNDLMGDPEIRKHFQIWNYLYPTSLPIIYNASVFRAKLDELQKHLVESSPERGVRREMVIISHSMGGLLTKTAVSRDSTEMYRYLFNNADKIREEDAELAEELDQYLDFKCKPYVARVIFVAVPFGGSLMATSWVGYLGRMLISLPRKVISSSLQLAHRIKTLLKPEYASTLDSEDFSSVQGLSPENPVLKALAQLAIDQQVPFHLIAGDQGLGGGEEASDGVVAYRSSHLPGAQSELIVPADHAAHAHPKAVREIKRILYLHLESLRQQGKPALPAKRAPQPIEN